MMDQQIIRFVRCKDCAYEAMSFLCKCSRCGGRLEITASEIKEEVGKER